MGIAARKRIGRAANGVGVWVVFGYRHNNWRAITILGVFCNREAAVDLLNEQSKNGAAMLGPVELDRSLGKRRCALRGCNSKFIPARKDQRFCSHLHGTVNRVRAYRQKQRKVA